MTHSVRNPRKAVYLEDVMELLKKEKAIAEKLCET